VPPDINYSFIIKKISRTFQIPRIIFRLSEKKCFVTICFVPIWFLSLGAIKTLHSFWDEYKKMYCFTRRLIDGKFGFAKLVAKVN
jgi:hypothetical protein